MSDCAFCNIIKKQANAYVVYESDTIEAFLDIEPIHEGHVLIVPKMHVSSIDELPLEVLTDIMELAQRIVAALKQVYGIEGYSMMQNGGCFCDFGHCHFHIFPRYEKDGFGWEYPTGGPFECSEKVAERIRAALK